MAIIGDTIKLQAEFYNWAGQLMNPENVVLKIYNIRKEQIGEDIEPTNTGIGQYEYDFTIPSFPNNMFYYEFTGQLEGTPIVNRKKIDNVWAL